MNLTLYLKLWEMAVWTVLKNNCNKIFWYFLWIRFFFCLLFFLFFQIIYLSSVCNFCELSGRTSFLNKFICVLGGEVMCVREGGDWLLLKLFISLFISGGVWKPRYWFWQGMKTFFLFLVGYENFLRICKISSAQGS